MGKRGTMKGEEKEDILANRVRKGRGFQWDLRYVELRENQHSQSGLMCVCEMGTCINKNEMK